MHIFCIFVEVTSPNNLILSVIFYSNGQVITFLIFSSLIDDVGCLIIFLVYFVFVFIIGRIFENN